MQIYIKDGSQIDIEVKGERNHLVVRVDGRFWCSCDNLREVGEEVSILASLSKDEIYERSI